MFLAVCVDINIVYCNLIVAGCIIKAECPLSELLETRVFLDFRVLKVRYLLRLHQLNNLNPKMSQV